MKTENENLDKFKKTLNFDGERYTTKVLIFRSSRPELFCKKAVLINFAKFTGKHLARDSLLIKLHTLFFNKVTVIRPATLLKKSLWNRCFPVNFAKFL